MLLIIKVKKYDINVNKYSMKFLTPINAVYNMAKKFCIKLNIESIGFFASSTTSSLNIFKHSLKLFSFF